MHKGKLGLQKEISKIFTGVHIPTKDASEPDTHPAAAAPAKYVSPKPVAVAPAQQPFTIPEPKEHPSPAPKPAVYEPPAPPPAPIRQSPKPPLRTTPFSKIWEQAMGRLLASKPGVSTSRQKTMILMAPVLAVVFIIVLMQVLRTPAGSAKKFASFETAAVLKEGKIDWELPPLYPETLRDPMSFTTTVTQAREDTGRPMVRGIVYSGDNPSAVVGDQIVSVGDVVDGTTVVKINPDSVEFAIGDKKWTQKVER